jgi:hypothetical protein
VTRIRANCPDCGDVELAPEEMLVEVSHDTEDLVGAGSSYRFVCPDCTASVRKPADERIVQLLISGGVPLEVAGNPGTGEGPWREPTAPAHPEAPAGGPPLTPDDLLDLHLLLQDDGWFDRLTRCRS